MLVTDGLVVTDDETLKAQAERRLRARLSTYESGDRSKGITFNEEEFDILNDMMMNDGYHFQAKSQ